MIYFSKENINNTDCDIIMHECFCKKTDKDIINEYVFNKFDVAQKAHQEYIGPEIEKIKTMKLTVDERTKKIIINAYTKLNKRLNEEKNMKKINHQNYTETIEEFFKIMQKVKERRPNIKIGMMNFLEDDGRDLMKIWAVLMEKSNEYEIDIHIINL